MRCAQQVALRRIQTVVSSICKNHVLNILSYLRNYAGQSTWVSTHMTKCAEKVFLQIEKSRFKHFVISQKLLGQWPECQRIVQQVAIAPILCCFFNMQKSRLKRDFCKLKKQQCIRRSATCWAQCVDTQVDWPHSFWDLQKCLNILSYLRNYGANRPECQRIVLSR